VLNATIETLANGRRIRVARLGSGPPLLMLHGYPDNLQIWSELAPRLAGDFEVIAFDWPGMGYSEPWPGGATPVHMADRLAVLLDSWRIARATIVGIDMGGQPALVFAAQHPDRIHRLVVMNSLVLWDEPTSWEIGLLRRYGWNRFLIRRLPRLVFERALATFLPPETPLPADLRRDLWMSFKMPEVRAFVARMCAGYQGTLPRLSEIYSRIACPTFILWAEKDRHFPRAHAERLHALIPGSRCAIVPGAMHWMIWNRAGEIARRVIEFNRQPGASL
jgi:pimeloyl-ACP methyl ester carboxylesterase